MLKKGAYELVSGGSYQSGPELAGRRAGKLFLRRGLLRVMFSRKKTGDPGFIWGKGWKGRGIGRRSGENTSSLLGKKIRMWRKREFVHLHKGGGGGKRELRSPIVIPWEERWPQNGRWVNSMKWLGGPVTGEEEKKKNVPNSGSRESWIVWKSRIRQLEACTGLYGREPWKTEKNGDRGGC